MVHLSFGRFGEEDNEEIVHEFTDYQYDLIAWFIKVITQNAEKEFFPQMGRFLENSVKNLERNFHNFWE
jgi:hypothetical protein